MNITNIRCREKTVTPPPRAVEETSIHGAYNSPLQLITSQTQIIGERVDQTKVESVDSGVLEHLLELVNELQKDLEIIIREKIAVRHEAKTLPEAINLDTVLRKLKVNLTGMVSRHQKIVELIMKEDDTKSTGSDHSGSTRQRVLPASICLNSAFPSSIETFSTGEHFGSHSESRFTADPSRQMLRI